MVVGCLCWKNAYVMTINIVDFWIEWSGTKIAYHDEKN